jgi:hypothetical protein
MTLGKVRSSPPLLNTFYRWRADEAYHVWSLETILLLRPHHFCLPLHLRGSPLLPSHRRPRQRPNWTLLPLFHALLCWNVERFYR